MPPVKDLPASSFNTHIYTLLIIELDKLLMREYRDYKLRFSAHMRMFRL